MKTKATRNAGSIAKRRAASPARTAASIVRPQVRDLLSASPGYRGLAADRQRQIADDTARVASYLVDPHGLISQEFRNPVLGGLVTSDNRKRRVRDVRTSPNAIRMSPLAMDQLVQAVDFPDFVQNLIDGVFGAIVSASIQQMEAFAALLARVSKSVDDFVSENIDDNAARDALLNEFPDTFCTGTTARLRFNAQARASDLTKLAAAIGLRDPAIDPKSTSELKRVVTAARRRLARNRQQVLATMVLMGINRIVVTNG